MVIKELNIANPFADNAGIVTGERFVGRQSEINEIHTRVLGELYGNLAIVGLPRIGKSSLVWNALIPLRDNLLKEKHILTYINVSEESSVTDFFKSLVLSILDVIEFDENYSSIYERLFIIYQKARENQNDRYEFKTYLNKFFINCKRLNLRITFILDEFDRTEQLFSVADFQLLRALGYEPDRKVCLVTVSRKTLQELEPENGAISNFYGVFSELRLQLFSENDLKAYWQRVEDLGLEISEEYKKEVHYFVGSHPYWLDMVNYHIFNGVKKGNKSSLELLSEIGSELKKFLWDNYDDIISLMEKEGLKSHFIQAVVGPVVNLTQMSIERLTKYGLVKPVLAREKYGTYFQTLIDAGLANESDISYNSISTHLNDYLKQKETEFDIWALWNEAEHQVRNLITIHLKEKYGEDWRDAFVAANPKKENDILRMEEMRARNKRTFGNLASDNLVSYTYPLDMWNCFISTDWTWFQRVLSGQQATWREKFLLLGKVRNPIAHSNRDFVLQDEQTKAKEICNELIDNIKKWEENK
jgi:AAA+ ATPase superfamily predicted ATPase